MASATATMIVKLYNGDSSLFDDVPPVSQRRQTTIEYKLIVGDTNSNTSWTCETQPNYT